MTGNFSLRWSLEMITFGTWIRLYLNKRVVSRINTHHDKTDYDAIDGNMTSSLQL